jgi:hypothetical protein
MGFEHIQMYKYFEANYYTCRLHCQRIQTKFPCHQIGTAIHALQAIHRVSDPTDADSAVAKERDGQYKHLMRIKRKTDSDGMRPLPNEDG